MASRFSRPPWTFGIHSPGLARIVEVEHRGDGIDAERVDVEAVQPVEGVGDEEVPHLGPPEIVDERVPVAVEAEARVLVLVERGAVEAGEAVRVGREMRRHPVDDDADARPRGSGRRSWRRPPAGRSGWSARRGRSAGSPTSRRRGYSLTGRQLDMGEAHVVRHRGSACRRARHRSGTRSPFFRRHEPRWTS